LLALSIFGRNVSDSLRKNATRATSMFLECEASRVVFSSNGFFMVLKGVAKSRWA